MDDDLVMRSVYLSPRDDAVLRQLAHRISTSKSDLIRTAISLKLAEWLEAPDSDLVKADMERARRPLPKRERKRGDGGVASGLREILAKDVKPVLLDETSWVAFKEHIRKFLDSQPSKI